MASPINYDSIPDLIRKAHSTLQHSQKAPSTISSTASSSCNNAETEKSRLRSFIGQIIISHPLSTSGPQASPVDPKSPRLDNSSHDPPLHSKAIQTFKGYKKKFTQPQKQRSPEANSDYIVWIAPVAERSPKTTSATRTRTRTGESIPSKRTTSLITTEFNPRKTISRVILVLDSDEESSGENHVLQERNRRASSASNSQSTLKRRHSCEVAEASDDSIGNDRRDRDASTISWSDSYAGSGSECDSEEEETPSQEHSRFREVVSVILSQSQQNQDGQDHTIVLDTIRPGDRIRVHNAPMLVQKLQTEESRRQGRTTTQETGADQIVVTCVGVPRTTTFTLSRLDHVRTWKAEKVITTPSTNDPQATASGSLEKAIKKRRISSKSSTLESEAGFDLHQCIKQLQQEKAKNRKRNPLELLVRKRSSSDPQTPLTKTLADLWEASIPAATYEKKDKEQEESMEEHHHICWKTRLQSVMIRAICAECRNDYRQMECTFGCRSGTWSVYVKLRCEISDGTAKAMLEVEGADDVSQDDNSQSREEMLWVLLGLSRKSSLEHGPVNGQGAPFEDIKNKVLQVLARRGEFSYTFDQRKTAASGKQPSQNKARGSSKATGSGQATLRRPGSGSVSSIGHDHTERAKAEEQLWLDVCSGAAGGKDPNHHFIIHATVDKNKHGHHQSLKTTSILIGRQYFQTLAPPPLILRATYVQRVTPLNLCRLLTKWDKQ
ncbi:hypothetical protein MVEG_03753 [Podila verticillata NRRL 6337]|nr:hypothetical protein MVEG_03753 [Podila verticillata NRRL 6337]